MNALSERIVTALEANKGVLLPAIQSLMEEAWAEGKGTGQSGGWNKDNPYAKVEPVFKTREEIASFANRWDARVEAGRKPKSAEELYFQPNHLTEAEKAAGLDGK